MIRNFKFLGASGSWVVFSYFCWNVCICQPVYPIFLAVEDTRYFRNDFKLLHVIFVLGYMVDEHSWDITCCGLPTNEHQSTRFIWIFLHLGYRVAAHCSRADILKVNNVTRRESAYKAVDACPSTMHRFSYAEFLSVRICLFPIILLLVMWHCASYSAILMFLEQIPAGILACTLHRCFIRLLVDRISMLSFVSCIRIPKVQPYGQVQLVMSWVIAHAWLNL